MQLVSGYILNEILSEGVLIPVGDVGSERAAYCLNETGCFLLKKLEEGCSRAELLDAVLENFDVTGETAEEAVSQFLTMLKKYRLLLNEEISVSQ